MENFFFFFNIFVLVMCPKEKKNVFHSKIAVNKLALKELMVTNGPVLKV